MMKRLRRIGVLCALLAGCAAEHDIVAQPLARDDGGALDVVDASVPGAPDAGAVEVCCSDAAGAVSDVPEAATAGRDACSVSADTLFLLTKEDNGRIYRVPAKTGIPEDLGAAKCLPIGLLALAVDTRGMLWVAGADGMVHMIDPDKLDCRPMLKLAPTMMTFGFDPETKQERLYALEVSELSVVDPVSLMRSAYGRLEPSWLAGTADGRLFALSDPSAGVVMIGEVSPQDAAVTTHWKIPLPFNQPLRAAALPSGGFALIFGTDLYRVPIGADRAELVNTLFRNDPGILAVAAPPCATLPK